MINHDLNQLMGVFTTDGLFKSFIHPTYVKYLLLPVSQM